jgi:hypothetical protein
MKRKQTDRGKVRTASANDLEKRREQIRQLRGSLSATEATGLRAEALKIRKRWG